MNKNLEKLIENNYIFNEAEEIKQFIKDKRLDEIIDKLIIKELRSCLKPEDLNLGWQNE